MWPHFEGTLHLNQIFIYNNNYIWIIDLKSVPFKMRLHTYMYKTKLIRPFFNEIWYLLSKKLNDSSSWILYFTDFLYKMVESVPFQNWMTCYRNNFFILIQPCPVTWSVCLATRTGSRCKPFRRERTTNETTRGN